jgi:hypothetical protein
MVYFGTISGFIVLKEVKTPYLKKNRGYIQNANIHHT